MLNLSAVAEITKSNPFPVAELNEWSLKKCLKFLELSEGTQKKYLGDSAHSTAGDCRKIVAARVRFLMSAAPKTQLLSPNKNELLSPPSEYNLLQVGETLNLFLFLVRQIMPSAFSNVIPIRIGHASTFNQDMIHLAQIVYQVLNPNKSF